MNNLLLMQYYYYFFYKWLLIVVLTLRINMLAQLKPDLNQGSGLSGFIFFNVWIKLPPKLRPNKRWRFLSDIATEVKIVYPKQYHIQHL